MGKYYEVRFKFLCDMGLCKVGVWMLLVKLVCNLWVVNFCGFNE